MLGALRDTAQQAALSGRGGPDRAALLAEADQAETAGNAARAYTLLRAVITG